MSSNATGSVLVRADCGDAVAGVWVGEGRVCLLKEGAVTGVFSEVWMRRGEGGE